MTQTLHKPGGKERSTPAPFKKHPSDTPKTALTVHNVLVASLLSAIDEAMKERSDLLDNEQQKRDEPRLDAHATRPANFSAIDDLPQPEAPPHQPQRRRSFRQVRYEEISYTPDEKKNHALSPKRYGSLSDGSTTENSTATGSDEQRNHRSGSTKGPPVQGEASMRSSRQMKRSTSVRRGGSRSRSRTRTMERRMTPPPTSVSSRLVAGSKAPPVTSHGNIHDILHQESDVVGVLTNNSQGRTTQNKRATPRSAKQLEKTLGQRKAERQRSLRARDVATEVLRHHLEQRLSGNQSTLKELRTAACEHSRNSRESAAESDESLIVPFQRKERSIYQQTQERRQSKSPTRSRTAREARTKKRLSISQDKPTGEHADKELPVADPSASSQIENYGSAVLDLQEVLKQQMEGHARHQSVERGGEKRTRKRSTTQRPLPSEATAASGANQGPRRPQSRRRMSMNKSSDSIIPTRRTVQSSAKGVSRSMSPSPRRKPNTFVLDCVQESPVGCRRTITTRNTSPSHSRHVKKHSLSGDDLKRHLTKSDQILLEKSHNPEIISTPNGAKSNNIKSILSSIRGSLGMRTPPKDKDSSKTTGMDPIKPFNGRELKHIPNLKPNRRDSLVAASKCPQTLELEMEDDFFNPSHRDDSRAGRTDDDEESINLEDCPPVACLEPCTPKRRPRKTARGRLIHNRSQSQLGLSSSSLMGRSSSSLFGRSSAQLEFVDLNERVQDRRSRQGSATAKQEPQLQPFQKRLSMAKTSHA